MPNRLIPLLDFLAPMLADTDEDLKVLALEFAESYRPWCLPKDKKDEAQVWYAAWILTNRLEQLSGVTYGIKMKKEQSLQIEYGGNGQTDDPFNYMARFKELEKLCSIGAIIAAGDPCGRDNCAR